jgi:hypothetical protein
MVSFGCPVRDSPQFEKCVALLGGGQRERKLSVTHLLRVRDNSFSEVTDLLVCRIKRKNKLVGKKVTGIVFSVCVRGVLQKKHFHSTIIFLP